MSYLDVTSGQVVSRAEPSERALFIRKTYAHVALCIALFVVMEAAMVGAGLDLLFMQVLSASPFMWLLVMGLFWFGSSITDRFARNSVSKGVQYGALAGSILLYAIVSLPLLGFAVRFQPGVLAPAAVITLSLAAGVSAVALITRKDFSFLRTAITVGSFVAIGLIVAAILFGFQLGVFFSFFVILIAAASLLYTTSNMVHHYTTDQYVGASLEVFSSIWLIFMHVVRLLMIFANND